MREIIGKVDFVKIQSTIEQLKNQAPDWEKIFANDILDCDSY